MGTYFQDCWKLEIGAKRLGNVEFSALCIVFNLEICVDGPSMKFSTVFPKIMPMIEQGKSRCRQCQRPRRLKFHRRTSQIQFMIINNVFRLLALALALVLT